MTEVSLMKLDEREEQVPTLDTNAIKEKFTDILTPGYQAEFDPEEAQDVGAFIEDALNEQDAVESSIDLVNGN